LLNSIPKDERSVATEVESGLRSRHHKIDLSLSRLPSFPYLCDPKSGIRQIFPPIGREPIGQIELLIFKPACRVAGFKQNEQL
jgi:hypothetical protein